jgi:hypothetical protein
VKAHADGLRGGNRVFEPHAIGKEIKMVGRKRASRQCQLGQPQPRRIEHIVGRVARPDRIERLEPAEQRGVLTSGTARVSDW